MTMKTHPAANLFPLLDGPEFDALVSDIRTNGLIEPIWTDTSSPPLIIDGRNRYRACLKAGVEPRYRTWKGKGSVVEFVVSLNLLRRHLNTSQKGVVAFDMLPLLEAEAKARMQAGRPKKGTEIIPGVIDKGEAREKAAKATGVNSHYVSDVKKLHESHPDLVDDIRAGNLTIPQAKKAVRTNAARAIRDNIVPVTCSGVVIGDFRALSSSIVDNSVDLVFTDPPYDRDSLSLYGDAARIASRILKPGGSFIAYDS